MPNRPGGDSRFKMLDAAIKRHQFKADALIEVLHAAQQLFDYLPNDLLLYIARSLRQPPSRVYGVATFYHLFNFAPKAAHECVVCMGTACYIMGAGRVQSALEKELGVSAGQTRGDGKAALKIVRCVGTCGLAPLVVVDGQMVGQVTPDKAVAHVKGWADRETR
jgi:bidirectional [NiFe] hydrogenase diaphorase subunit